MMKIIRSFLICTSVLLFHSSVLASTFAESSLKDVELDNSKIILKEDNVRTGNGSGKGGGFQPLPSGPRRPTPPAPRPTPPAPRPTPPAPRPTPPAPRPTPPAPRPTPPAPRPTPPAPRPTPPAPRPTPPAPRPTPPAPRPNRGPSRNEGDVQRERDQNKQDRVDHQADNRQRDGRFEHDQIQWNRTHSGNFQIDLDRIHSRDTWVIRFNEWQVNCQRPDRDIFDRLPAIIWYTPMPNIDYDWHYNDLIPVAQNLEFLSRNIFDTLDPMTPRNTENGMRLRNAMFQVEAATNNFYATLQRTYDWQDSVNDLFYLEQGLNLLQITLQSNPNDYLVSGKIEAMKAYVNQLLWTYRINY